MTAAMSRGTEERQTESLREAEEREQQKRKSHVEPSDSLVEPPFRK